MTNLEAVLALATALGVNVSSFTGRTTADAIAFIAANYTAPQGLPAVTATNNGKILKVVEGKWQLANDAVE